MLTLGLAFFSRIYTMIRHDQCSVHGWFIFTHRWENSTIYKESEKKNYVEESSKLSTVIYRHYNHHLPTLMVSSCGIHLAMFNKSAWIFSDPLALSSTAKQKQGDVILEKSPLASQNSWFQHVEQTHLNKKIGPLLSASWIGCLYLYLLLRWIYTFI